MPYVYMVSCRDGSLYTGFAVNLDDRIRQHNRGKGAKYTRGRLPVTLCYYEVCDTVNEALRREIELKKFSKKKKLALVASQSGHS